MHYFNSLLRLTLTVKTLIFCLWVGFLCACGTNPKKVEDADLKFQLARTLHDRGQIIEAIRSMQESIKTYSKNAEAHNYLGLLYFERKMLVESKKSFENAVKVDPKYSEGYNHLCVVQSEMGRLQEAIASCNKALENVLYATPERPCYNLALIYEKLGESEKVKESHERAVGYNPRFVLSLAALGKIAYEKKDYKSALNYLESAKEVCDVAPKGAWQQTCAVSNYDLALAYLQQSNTSKAKQAFKDCVLQSNEDEEYFRKCQDRLKILR